MKKFTVSIAALLLATGLHAESFQKASEIGAQELVKANQEYNATLNRISEERMPLTAKLEELEAEAKQLRKEKQEVQGTADTATYSLDILKDQVKKM